VKERYTIEGASDTLKIKSESPISYINFDPGKYLISEVELEQSDESWMTLYRNSSLAIDQWKALTALEKDSSDKNMAFYAEVIKHENEDIRSKGLAYYMRLYKQNNSDSILDLVSTYANDESWRIRYTAISFLKDSYDEEKMKQLCMNSVNDSSIWVSSIAISSLGAVDPDETRKLIDGMGEIEYSAIAAAVAGFYMDQGLASDHETLIGIMRELDGYAMYQNLTKYSEYLQKLPAAEVYPSISFLKEECLDANQWWVRMAAINTTIALHKYLKENFDGEVIHYSQEQMESPNMSDFADEKSQIGFSLALVRAILEEVEKKETRANLVSNVSNYLEEK
jgi:HEAT repeat protein